MPSVLGTATTLPFADGAFDVVFSSFGALQFISDLDGAVAETARVLRPGGRFAFSITHPTRWMFPDDPGEAGLVASQSYWDRTPYVEVDDATGMVSYVEHHRTLGDWVGLLAGHGFAITDLLEPEWPEGHDRVWGGWSGIRGRLTPGTAIFGATLGDVGPAAGEVRRRWEIPVSPKFWLAGAPGRARPMHKVVADEEGVAAGQVRVDQGVGVASSHRLEGSHVAAEGTAAVPRRAGSCGWASGAAVADAGVVLDHHDSGRDDGEACQT